MEAVLLRELSKLEPGVSEEVWLVNGSAWWYVKPNDWLSQHRHPEHLPNAPETQDTYGALIPKSGFSSGLDGKESTCNARDSLLHSVSLLTTFPLGTTICFPVSELIIIPGIQL